jgi:Fe-S-cluster containining protein
MTVQQGLPTRRDFMITCEQRMRSVSDQQDEFVCRKTGICCHIDIPVTLPDLHRISRNLELPPEIAFRDFVHQSALIRSGLFMLKKRDDRACPFLGDDNLCTIHAFKPKICAFFQCGTTTKDNFMALLHNEADPDSRKQALRHLVATALTRAYLEANGMRWNELDYRVVMKHYDDYCRKSFSRSGV